MSKQAAAQQLRYDPPQLWRVQQLDSRDALVRTVDVCVAKVHLDGFRRPASEVNGRPCINFGPMQDSKGVYATRCKIDERAFKLRVATTSDGDTAFQTATSLRPQDGGPAASQIRRYQRLGPCPPGWDIGRQMRRPDQSVPR